MDETSADGQLSALEMTWTLRARQDVEPKQGLSVGRIVAAAVAMADSEGLGAVSMGRVAKSLGFTTMSLYRHIRSKEELLLMMQDAAVGPPGPDVEAVPAGGWREGLERWAWSVVGCFRRHPWILQTVPMFGPPATPNQLAWLERGLRMLAGTGLAEEEKLLTIMLIDAHVIGDIQFAGAGAGTTPPAAEDPYVTLLTKVLDPQEFPALVHAMQSGVFEESGDDEADRDAAFAFGLARILDGLEHLMASRSA